MVAATTSTSWSSCTTPTAPIVRTSMTPPCWRNRDNPWVKPVSIAATWACHAPVAKSDREAKATRQAKGLPMKVGPCMSTPESEAPMPLATLVVHKAAAAER